MSFMSNLPCQNPASFTSMDRRKMPDETRTPVAHDVPLSSEEKTIFPDRTPYFLRLLQAHAAKNSGEASTSAKTKKGKRRHDEDEGEEVTPRARKNREV